MSGITLVDPSLLRDQLVSLAWKHREESIAAMERLAKELPVGITQRVIAELLGQWKQCNIESDIQQYPRLLEWITCFVDPGAPQARQRTHRMLHRHAMNHQRLRQVRQWFGYPIILVFVFSAVLLFFCFFVVPEFDRMFLEFGLNLPPTTEFLVTVSRRLQQLGVVAVGVGGLVLLGLAWGLKRWCSGTHEDRLRRTNFFSRFASASRSINAFHDLKDFHEIGLKESEAIALTWDRLEGRFYHATDATHWRIATSYERLGFPTPLRGLLAVEGGQDDAARWSMKSDLAYSWAMIHENRMANRSQRHWMILFDVCLKSAIGIAIGFLVHALFGPLVSLISGLT